MQFHLTTISHHIPLKTLTSPFPDKTFSPAERNGPKDSQVNHLDVITRARGDYHRYYRMYNGISRGGGPSPRLRGGGRRYWSNKNQRIKFTSEKRHSKLSFRFPPLRSGGGGEGGGGGRRNVARHPIPHNSGTEYSYDRIRGGIKRSRNDPEIILASESVIAD